MMLADQGARVIKVEPPGGDNTRRIGPWAEGQTRMEDGGYGARVIVNCSLPSLAKRLPKLSKAFRSHTLLKLGDALVGLPPLVVEVAELVRDLLDGQGRGPAVAGRLGVAGVGRPGLRRLHLGRV